MHGRTHLIIGHTPPAVSAHTTSQRSTHTGLCGTAGPREEGRGEASGGLGVPSVKHMFPFCDSSSASRSSPMDLPLYQQLQLSPPSPKQSQSTSFLYYYPCSSPPFSAADAASLHQLTGSYHQPLPSPELPLMEPAPAPELLDAASANAAQQEGAAASLDPESRARKDRHSKISTAGGMRDRRMRLSLDVARKFFALQDMLGFDKASKTVQWLLNTSKAAIQEIMADDAESECVEDGSSSGLSVDGKPTMANPAAELLLRRGGAQQQPTNKPAKARKAAANPKPAKNAAAHPVADKESRAKARERARERTKEKHRMRWVKLASAIDVEAAAVARVDRPPSSNSNNNLMMSHHHQLEERCSSSTLNNNGGSRMQEITGASSDVILGFGNGGGGGGYGAAGNYYCQQEQWDLLGGVVFQQNPRFY